MRCAKSFSITVEEGPAFIIQFVDTNNPGFAVAFAGVTRMGSASYLVDGTNVFVSNDNLAWSLYDDHDADGGIANNGSLLVTADGFDLYSSVFGLDWILRETLGGTMNAVIYANGKFVAIGTQGIFGISSTSPDGITWSVPIGPMPGDFYIRLAFGVLLFVSISATQISSSVTGESDAWTLRETSVIDDLEDIAFGNGIFVVASETSIHTSTDGINWIRTVLPITLGLILRAVSFANGEFVLSGQASSAGSKKSFNSPDGLNWTELRDWSAAGDYEIVSGVALGNDHFLTVLNLN